MNIYGESIVLRAMEPEDMEKMRETANDPKTESLVGGWSFPISRYEQMKWYEKVVSNPNSMRFTIERLDNGEAVGMVNLVDIDWKNRAGFHGIRLFKDAPRKQGYGTDAVMALMRYAFEELQLVRIDTTWIEYNEPSLKLYEKCGWTVEGRKKKGKYTSGKYYDVLFGGVLAEDYYATKERMNWIPYDQK